MRNPFVTIFGTLVINGLKDFKTDVPKELKKDVGEFLKEKGKEDLIK